MVASMNSGNGVFIIYGCFGVGGGFLYKTYVVHISWSNKAIYRLFYTHTHIRVKKLQIYL